MCKGSILDVDHTAGLCRASIGESDDDGLQTNWILWLTPAAGATQRLSCIARLHQEGQKAPVEPGGPLAQYPVRVVLGFADAGRELVRDRLVRYLVRQLQ
ncbi:Phage tail completion protein [Burkholderia pseudomallei]|nr:Phage tail completion protein [Burkholderia pseudomallei]CAJ9168735.1 Phage tail completion protein [Burkholderia pseudomallei]CAK0156625.1 Phage tail completion protein [Burkholderia pseudomallei]